MEPDRKQPARAHAMSARHNDHGSSQAPLQSQDWYVIADEGELTLRISSGLRVGEDRWGELTLNHPLSAHRWLEFTIDADGELWCRSSRKDIVVRSDGEIQDEVLLDAGVPITLPHNLLHISNHIRRGRSSDRVIEVGLLEAQTSSELDSFADLVDTQADVTPVPESQPSVSNESNPESPPSSSPPSSALTSASPTSSSPKSSANDSVETYIPTLEAVVVAPRDTASEEAGPAIERAVAKLKNRSQAFGGRGALNSADSTESALVPVDANGPFHTDEIRAALQQPIDVGEPGEHRSTRNDHPIYTPTVTTSIVAAVPDSRLRLVAGFAITLLLVLGAALIVAITAASNNQQQRSLASNPTQEANPAVAAPGVGVGVTAAAGTTQPIATSSESRTKSLLQTASALLSNPGDLQTDTLEFAIRSLNLVLAAQPENPDAQRLLATAEQIRSDRKPPVVTPQPEASSLAATVDFTASDRFSGNLASDAFSTPYSNYTYADPRLQQAARLIAQGVILAPRESSAIALIMSVLAEDPSLPEAVRLLNRSASVLVAQADEEYETLGVYAARNTLEEVLSFHPKHGPANQRWRTWVDAGSPMSAAPQVIRQPEINLEDTP